MGWDECEINKVLRLVWKKDLTGRWQWEAWEFWARANEHGNPYPVFTLVKCI